MRSYSSFALLKHVRYCKIQGEPNYAYLNALHKGLLMEDFLTVFYTTKAVISAKKLLVTNELSKVMAQCTLNVDYTRCVNTLIKMNDK